MKNIRIGISFGLCCLLFPLTPSFAEMHVLSLQSVTGEGGAQGDEPCYDYLLEQVDLNVVHDRFAEPGTISILNADNQPIVARKLEAGEQGRIDLKLKAADDRTLSRGVIIQLLKLDVDNESISIETTETDTEGRAQFDQQLQPGSYQIAVSCGGPMLAVPALLSAGGGGALAISLLPDRGSSSSAPRSSQTTLPNQEVTSDLWEPSYNDDGIRGSVRPPRPPTQPAASPSAP